MSKFLFTGLVAAAALASAASPAMAAPTVFTTTWDSTNFGSGPGFVILSSYEGWTGTPAGLEVQYNNVAGTPFSGANLVELDTTRNSSITRTINAGNYLLRFYYSDRPNVSANSNGINVSVGSTNLVSVAGGNGGSNTNFRLFTTRFVTTGPQTLTFAATGVSDSLGGYIDDISLSGVPEPTTWALMIGGFGMVGGAMRRRGSRKLVAA
ncbi:MAG: PEPxxWA-CTERM sorting domain-containing protein [Sphingomonas sp.]